MRDRTLAGSRTAVAARRTTVLRERLRLGPTAAAGAFLAASVAAMLTGASLVAWCGIGLSSAALLILSLQLMPGASRLVLDEDGFTLVSLWRRWRFRWCDVGPFHHFPNRLSGMVSFDIRAKSGAVVSFNRRFSGGDAGALTGSYGMRTADLAALMNEWRDAALSGTGQ